MLPGNGGSAQSAQSTEDNEPWRASSRSAATSGAHAGDGIPRKCELKCDAACFHEAPNERRATADGRAFADVAERRLARRTLLKGAAVAPPLLLATSSPAAASLIGGSSDAPAGATLQAGTGTTAASPAPTGASLGFTPIRLGDIDDVIVPDGYEAKVLMRWGDPIHSGIERMTAANVSRHQQTRTFGWNADLNAYFPLSEHSSGRAASGLLCVNHEYTEGDRMFSDYDAANPTKDQVDVEIAAHGMSIITLESTPDGGWSVDLTSRYNRRITGFTPMEITGPLASHELLETSADPTGRRVLGTLNNCAGGKTPWGTVLTAEENFHQYFANNDMNDSPRLKEINERYGVPAGASRRKWERYHRRFDLAKEPNEINRFGYIVEIDPHDRSFVPKKRTALGRFKHEAATTAMADSGQVVLYSGDDERFDYLYKFVTAGSYNPDDRQANFSLLDSGTLYVAKFHDDGTGEWLPLVGGREGPLADLTQAEVLLNTRGAADLLEATPMDRPEDVEVNPRNNRVYVCLTNNVLRTAGDENAVNPRAQNRYGHVLEITEDGGDLSSVTFTWEFFLICGEPADPSTFFAGFDKSSVSPIAAPDNLAFDEPGNVWIATDGQPSTLMLNDTLFAVPSSGSQRGNVQPFLSVPRGAEVCGPEFTPDFETLFVNVQHPGEASAGPENPQSLWPDGVWPPLPSLVVVTKTGGGRIGS